MIDPTESYRRALDELSEPGPEPGSSDEQAAIERFKDFFSVLSADNVQAKIRAVYADRVFFNDTLSEVRTIDQLERHLVKSAKATVSTVVEVTDVAAADGNYYFRWVMDIEFRKLRKGTVTRSIGISHIRFNRAGKVVLHQDYWDATAGLFEHVPLIGGLLRYVKGKL
ncbi:MAG: nuclear transport factor 2 family protein [Myxococcota bacterium]